MDEKTIRAIIFNLQAITETLSEYLKSTLGNEQEPSTPEKKEEAVNQEVKVKLEDIRVVLIEKARSGKREQVQTLIQSYGVGNLSEVPAEMYADILEKAKVL